MFNLVVILAFFGASIVLFSNSPFYRVFGVLLQSISYSFLVFYYGFSFLGLIIILFYVGGLLIVILFSTALTVEQFTNINYVGIKVLFIILIFIISKYFFPLEIINTNLSIKVIESELWFGELYGSFGYITVAVAFLLYLALVISLCLKFGHSVGNLRRL